MRHYGLVIISSSINSVIFLSAGVMNEYIRAKSNNMIVYKQSR